MRGLILIAVVAAAGCARGAEDGPQGTSTPVVSGTSPATTQDPWVPDSGSDDPGPGMDTDGEGMDDSTGSGLPPPMTSGPGSGGTTAPPPGTTGMMPTTDPVTTDPGFGDSSGGFGTDSGGGGGGQIGDDCINNSDCLSNVCVDDGVFSFCSELCNSIFDCPLGWDCVETDTAGVNVCY